MYINTHEVTTPLWSSGKVWMEQSFFTLPQDLHHMIPLSLRAGQIRCQRAGGPAVLFTTLSTLFKTSFAWVDSLTCDIFIILYIKEYIRISLLMSSAGFIDLHPITCWLYWPSITPLPACFIDLLYYLICWFNWPSTTLSSSSIDLLHFLILFIINKCQIRLTQKSRKGE